MPLAFNLPHRRRFFYPISTLGKFAERLRPEDAAHGIPRQNKLGITVYEKWHDAVSGRILDFSIIPPNGKIHDPQYQIILVDPDDTSTQGYVYFGQNTSLGRQLVNQLLSLTPEMLSDVITFTLSTSIRHSGRNHPPGNISGNDERLNVYLNLYRGREVLYKHLIPRRFARDEIPQPHQTPDGKWDFTSPNLFFYRHAVEFADYLRDILPKLSGAQREIQRPAPDRPSTKPSTSLPPTSALPPASANDISSHYDGTNDLAGENESIPESIIPF